MAKKKVKKLSEEERAVLAEERKQKAEAKQKAAAEKAEYNAKKKQYNTMTVVCLIAALAMAFFGIAIFGEERIALANMVAYALMGVCGFCMMKGSNYEPDEKKSSTRHFTGMAFAGISLMMVVTELFRMITG